MKKTLIICPEYPLPENSGSNIRTMNFARFFMQFGPIDIAYYRIISKEEKAIPIFLNKYLLELIDRSKSFKRRLINGVISGVPIPVKNITTESQHFLLSLIVENDYDYIVVRYVHSCSCLFRLTKKYRQRIILDVDDIQSGSLYGAKFGSINKIFKKYAMNINRRLLVRYEKKCLKLGTSLFCSKGDQQQLEKSEHNNESFVVPNIFIDKSFDLYNFGDGFAKRNILLFVGTLNYGPNSEGLTWFINNIFPHFKIEYPDGKLIVVGRTPAAPIREMCEGTPGVDLYTDVPDVKEFYKQCRVAVIPLLSGGGTRIKILETIRADRPVISTSKGAEGLGLNDSREILIFETANEFLCCYKKIKEKVKYHSLVRNAKYSVNGRYSEKKFKDVMGLVIRSIEEKRH
jgi:glycosyltransferase involved in cell wall biosynthesis